MDGDLLYIQVRARRMKRKHMLLLQHQLNQAIAKLGKSAYHAAQIVLLSMLIFGMALPSYAQANYTYSQVTDFSNQNNASVSSALVSSRIVSKAVSSSYGELIIGPDNNLWTAQNSSGNIYSIPTSGGVRRLIATVANARGLCLASDQRVWFGKDTGTTDSIWAVDVDGNVTEYTNINSGLGRITNIIPDNDQAALWCVANDANGDPSFIKVDQSGNVLLTSSVTGTDPYYAGTGSFYNEASGVVYNGFLWSAVRDSGTPSTALLVKMDVNDGTYTTYSFTNTDLDSFCVGPDNNIWALDVRHNAIYVFDTDGNKLATYSWITQYAYGVGGGRFNTSAKSFHSGITVFKNQVWAVGADSNRLISVDPVTNVVSEHYAPEIINPGMLCPGADSDTLFGVNLDTLDVFTVRVGGKLIVQPDRSLEAPITMLESSSSATGPDFDVSGYATVTLLVTISSIAPGASLTIFPQGSVQTGYYTRLSVVNVGISGPTLDPRFGTANIAGLGTFAFAVSTMGMRYLRINGTTNVGSVSYKVQAIRSRDNRIVSTSYNDLTQGGSLLSQSNPIPVQIQSHTKATYHACTPQYAIPATPTDLITFYGSASKVVRILHIRIYKAATSATVKSFYLIRRSSANTGGTFNSVSDGPGNRVAKHDSSNADHTATFGYYTANPTTLGSEAGRFIDGRTMDVPDIDLAVRPLWQDLWDEKQQGQPIVLRGANEGIALNFGGAALPAGMKVGMEITWTEE